MSMNTNESFLFLIPQVAPNGEQISRLDTNHVGNYLRYELDRDCAYLHADFSTVLGDQNTPQAKIMESIERKSTARVLDAGCGTGRMLYDLGEYMVQTRQAQPEQLSLVAMNQEDFSKESKDGHVRSAYKRGDIPYILSDIVKVQLPDNHFDVIYSHNVLTGMDKPEAAINEMIRLLCPGGSLLFNVTRLQQRSLLDRTAYGYSLRRHGEVIHGEIVAPWTENDGYTYYCITKSNGPREPEQ